MYDTLLSKVSLQLYTGTEFCSVGKRNMTNLSSKVELYDAAVCVLREGSATAIEQCIHEVGGTITECQRNKRPAVGVEEYSVAVVDTAEGMRCFSKIFCWLYPFDE